LRIKRSYLVSRYQSVEKSNPQTTKNKNSPIATDTSISTRPFAAANTRIQQYNTYGIQQYNTYGIQHYNAYGNIGRKAT
jgi:hypothetical protein